MGLLKSMGELQKQGRALARDHDPASQIAQATASMAAAQEAMAQQTRAASLAVTGLAGVATIGGVRMTGGMINFQPLLDIDLTVAVPGRPPMPATVSGAVEQIHLARAQVGAQVAVKVDPADPSAVWIDWMAQVPSS